jgi:hypothetical protein
VHFIARHRIGDSVIIRPDDEASSHILANLEFGDGRGFRLTSRRLRRRCREDGCVTA